uniref:Adenine DNA glycosylase n=1 Tax=Candidatus Kentrum sp. FW TaxID=2126338 RepID=A0A450SQG6_9GAMM|nr:MAG: A/G-specific DNA-adenine glycosylase [Candidatus Kentron sp. FW]
METGVTLFSDLILAWYEKRGGRDLPWQRDVTAYRVWISEIMLQQTRAGTVIEYFEDFVARFPKVEDLALAEMDEVLHLWSGLGYYARARNLHKAARIVLECHEGEFPTDFHEVCLLPGIGRSTAGAILALALGQRHAILDGNVKRVLTRYHAIAGWPGDTVIGKRLWALAERYTPRHRVAEYTQAMMDLGAMVCTRTRPACPDCPLCDTCLARAEGHPEGFPTRRPRKTLPVRATRFVLVVRMGRDFLPPIQSVLLEKRPATGIWGGLWSFPECALEEDIEVWCITRLGNTPTDIRSLPSFRHTFTHFHLDIHPMLLSYESIMDRDAMDRTPVDMAFPGLESVDNARIVWYPLDKSSRDKPPALGFAAPVVKLLDMCAVQK